MYDLDVRLESYLGPDKKIYHPVLPAWTAGSSSSLANGITADLSEQRRQARKEKEIDHSEVWRKWSGNGFVASIQSDRKGTRSGMEGVKYPTSSSNDGYTGSSGNGSNSGQLGQYLSIAFRPPFWQQYLQNKKQEIAAAAADNASSTAKKKQLFTGDNNEDGLYEELLDGEAGSSSDDYDNMLSPEAFLRRACPQLFIFLYENVNDLEDLIVEESFRDQEMIIEEGHSTALTIIR